MSRLRTSHASARTERAAKRRAKHEALTSLAKAGGLPVAPLSEDERKARTADAAADLARAYAIVDERDKLISWVSGRLLYRRGGPASLLTHHHLDRRSREKGRIADPFNIVSVSAIEALFLDSHDLIAIDYDGVECHDTRHIVTFDWLDAQAAEWGARLGIVIDPVIRPALPVTSPR